MSRYAEPMEIPGDTPEAEPHAQTPTAGGAVPSGVLHAAPAAPGQNDAHGAQGECAPACASSHPWRADPGSNKGDAPDAIDEVQTVEGRPRSPAAFNDDDAMQIDTDEIASESPSTSPWFSVQAKVLSSPAMQARRAWTSLAQSPPTPGSATKMTAGLKPVRRYVMLPTEVILTWAAGTRYIFDGVVITRSRRASGRG